MRSGVNEPGEIKKSQGKSLRLKWRFKIDRRLDFMTKRGKKRTGTENVDTANPQNERK